MSKKELLKRYILFILGLFVNALGVSLITKANLGTSPISSIPYTLSMGFPLTMGQFTFILNLVLIAGQIIFLRKDFQKVQLIQIPISVLFGYFIDLTMSLLSFFSPSDYIVKIASLLAGCIILAFGVSLEVIANVVMLSGEAFVKAISTKLEKEFGTTKICFDTTLTIGACIISLVMFGKIAGVREGTVIAAFIVGLIAKFFNRHLACLDKLLCDNASAMDGAIPSSHMQEGKNKIIITIAREFGSGGHEIGQKLAEELNIAFYDKEIISYTAKESGYSEDYIADHEQTLNSPFLYDLVTQNYAYSKETLSRLDAIFAAQSTVIKEIANQGSCVIVGRCADFILQNQEDITRVFIHANEESRIERIVNVYNFEKEVAKTSIHKNDKGRKNFCKRYAGQDWGNAKDYNLTIDSSVFGIDGAVRIIKGAVNQRKYGGITGYNVVK